MNNYHSYESPDHHESMWKSSINAINGSFYLFFLLIYVPNKGNPLGNQQENASNLHVAAKKSVVSPTLPGPCFNGMGVSENDILQMAVFFWETHYVHYHML